LEASRARVTRLLEELTALQGSGHLALLKERPIQDALKLKGDQRSRASQSASWLSDQWQRAFRDFRKADQAARRARTLALARVEEKEVAEILAPEQAQRFRQLVLQLEQRSPFGFCDPHLVRALGLTSKQREQIRWILRAAYPRTWDAWPYEPPGPP